MRRLIAVIMVILIGAASTANAQKLPTVQQTSVWAPSTIKIDGKAIEWGNKFQAYNKTTEVYYTVANDDNKLYLVVQATDETIIRKIVIGGITLTINKTANKNDKNGMAISFPKYDKRYPALFLILNNRPELTKDTVKNRIQSDSSKNEYNKQIAAKFKMIDVRGLKGIASAEDDMISVYNEDGINAAALFDNKIHYTYELAVPLKYLGIDNKSVKFNYNIKLNGELPSGSQVVDVGRPDLIMFTGSDGKNYLIGKATPENLTLSYPTDFWGEYTLAKK